MTIDALGGQGDGVARLDSGEVVFVPDVAPGDRVRVQLTGKRKGVRRAVPRALVTPSADRVRPRCPVAQTCGGCQWQHVSLARQHAEKLRNATKALGLAPTPMGATPPFGWRRRTRFHLRRVDGVLRAGFMGSGSDELVAVDTCPVLAPPLDSLPAKVATWAAEWLKRGEALAHVGAEGVVLRVQGVSRGKTPPPSAEVAASLGVVGLQVETQAGTQAWGQREVTLSETVDLHPVRVDAAGFSQASADANVAIRAAVAAAIERCGPLDTATELYAGSGNLTGLLLDAAPRVHTVELSEAAVVRARAAFGDAVAEGRLRAKVGDAGAVTRRPKGNELWLLDPGRPGAKDACHRITKLRPPHVVYVSCAPDTLRRDLRTLRQGGYAVTAAWWVDTFPHTPHLEVVALLSLARQPTPA